MIILEFKLNVVCVVHLQPTSAEDYDAVIFVIAVVELDFCGTNSFDAIVKPA